MTRKEAIARIKDHMSVHKMYEERGVKITEALNMAIEALEQPKTGEWINDKSIYKCSTCGYLCTVAGWADCIPEEQMYKTFKFCPNCGKKMQKGEKNDNFSACCRSQTERRWNPCDWCAYNPPSSMDGKPCTVCPAVANPE